MVWDKLCSYGVLTLGDFMKKITIELSCDMPNCTTVETFVLGDLRNNPALLWMKVVDATGETLDCCPDCKPLVLASSNYVRSPHERFSAEQIQYHVDVVEKLKTKTMREIWAENGKLLPDGSLKPKHARVTQSELSL